MSDLMLSFLELVPDGPPRYVPPPHMDQYSANMGAPDANHVGRLVGIWGAWDDAGVFKLERGPNGCVLRQVRPWLKLTAVSEEIYYEVCSAGIRVGQVIQVRM